MSAYSSQFNPIERIWHFLKERYLSHRLLDDYDVIVEVASTAWNTLLAEPSRLTSLIWTPWKTEAS